MYVPQLRLRDCIAINLHICYVSAAMTSAIADTQAPSNYPGGTLRDLVRAQGRRQNWIAARLGISNGLLNLTVVGGRPISPAIAGGLAGILGVPVEDVLAASRASQIEFHAGRLRELGVDESCAVGGGDA